MVRQELTECERLASRVAHELHLLADMINQTLDLRLLHFAQGEVSLIFDLCIFNRLDIYRSLIQLVSKALRHLFSFEVGNELVDVDQAGKTLVAREVLPRTDLLCKLLKVYVSMS